MIQPNEAFHEYADASYSEHNKRDRKKFLYSLAYLGSRRKDPPVYDEKQKQNDSIPWGGGRSQFYIFSQCVITLNVFKSLKYDFKINKAFKFQKKWHSFSPKTKQVAKILIYPLGINYQIDCLCLLMTTDKLQQK